MSPEHRATEDSHPFLPCNISVRNPPPLPHPQLLLLPFLLLCLSLSSPPPTSCRYPSFRENSLRKLRALSQSLGLAGAACPSLADTASDSSWCPTRLPGRGHIQGMLSFVASTFPTGSYGPAPLGDTLSAVVSAAPHWCGSKGHTSQKMAQQHQLWPASGAVVLSLPSADPLTQFLL